MKQFIKDIASIIADEPMILLLGWLFLTVPGMMIPGFSDIWAIGMLVLFLLIPVIVWAAVRIEEKWK